MTLDQQIQSICTKAISLPQCPVKREHAIAQRVWLANQINELLKQQQQSEGYKPQMELK